MKLLHAEKENTSQRILITGPTKRAVIEIMNRLRPVLSSMNQNFLTLICMAGASSNDYDFIMDNDGSWQLIQHKISCHGVKKIEKSQDVQETFDSILSIRDMILDSKKSNKIIIVATHYHSLYPLMSGVSVKAKPSDGDIPLCELFDHVLVDESSQIDVPNSIAILNTLDRSGSITFIGDHLQMLPIQSAPAPIGAENMLSSIQQYLVKISNILPNTLLENYRSVKEIVDFGHRIGYPVDLTAKGNIDYMRFNPEQLRPCQDYRLKMDTALTLSLLGESNPVISIRYRDGISGQANPFEAMITVNLITTCFEHMIMDSNYDGEFAEVFWSKIIGVVTPHKAQRALIVCELFLIFPESLHSLIDAAIDTVERFQGGERNFIIVSYGVGDEDIIKQEEEFLINLNRTNVSISRAKQKVIVLMSQELATHLTNDEDLVSHAKAIKRFDHYCQKESTFKIPWLEGFREVNYRYLSGSN